LLPSILDPGRTHGGNDGRRSVAAVLMAIAERKEPADFDRRPLGCRHLGMLK
jgi:hypothetical protein